MSDFKVNYIKHLTEISALMYEETSFTSAHISLYFALFQFWNLSKFNNPISIARSETMKMAKIGSKTTYYRALKDLSRLGYINYHPSSNPMIGSQLIMYTSDELKSKNQSSKSSIKNGTTTSTSVSHIKDDKCTDTVPNMGIVEVPSKNKRNIKTIKQKTESGKLKFSPPKMEELIAYFLTNNSTDLEAQKFFNYFESNGWLVGGKTKMKNWKAAVRNWILNSQKWNPPDKPAPGNLHTDQAKDYNIPL